MSAESVAVVGASPRGNRGTTILRNLRRLGFGGKVHVINPRAGEVEGFVSLPSLDELPGPVDLVAVARNAEGSVATLEEAGRLGIPAALLIASGIDQGSALAAEAQAVIQHYGIAVCGPNCYGVLNVETGLAAYSGGLVHPLVRGSVGLVLQSGALSHSILETSQDRELGVAAVATSGNELDLSAADYVDWMARNSEVRAIGVYLEALRDPVAFGRAARAAAEADKPVVVLSVGRSERGRATMLAHTGAVAGSRSAQAGYFRALGVLPVRDVDEFRETLLLLTSERRPRTSRPFFASISGAAASLVADFADDVALPLPELAPATAARLVERHPMIGVPNNPLDVTGMAADDLDLFADLLTILDGQADLGCLVLLFNHASPVPGGTLHRRLAERLGALVGDRGIPAVAVAVAAGSLDTDLQRTLAESGIPLLLGIRPAMVALRHWLTSRASDAEFRWRESGPADDAILLGRSGLVGAKALHAVESAGIPAPNWSLVGSPDEAADAAGSDRPVVLKIDHQAVVHKTDIGGVVVGVRGVDDVRRAADRLLDLAPTDLPDGPAQVLVQDMVDDPVAELLVGVVRDAQVGLVLTVAPGGTLAELFGEAETRPLPVDSSTVHELLKGRVLDALLQGFRDQPPADIQALVDAVVRFGNFVAEHGKNVSAAEINPLMVLPDGKGVRAVDARFVGTADGPEH